MRFWPAAKLTCCDRNICGDCRGRTKAKGERLKDKGRFDRPSFSASWFSEIQQILRMILPEEGCALS